MLGIECHAGRPKPASTLMEEGGRLYSVNSLNRGPVQATSMERRL